LQETWESESARQSSVVYPVSIQERLVLPRAMVGLGIQGENADSRARGEQSVVRDWDEAVRDISDDNNWRTPIIRCLRIMVVPRMRKFGGSRLSMCWSVTSYIDARWRVCS
jgi:hypothetical protein